MRSGSGGFDADEGNGARRTPQAVLVSDPPACPAVAWRLGGAGPWGRVAPAGEAPAVARWEAVRDHDHRRWRFRLGAGAGRLALGLGLRRLRAGELDLLVAFALQFDLAADAFADRGRFALRRGAARLGLGRVFRGGGPAAFGLRPRLRPVGEDHAAIGQALLHDLARCGRRGCGGRGRRSRRGGGGRLGRRRRVRGQRHQARDDRKRRDAHGCQTATLHAGSPGRDRSRKARQRFGQVIITPAR